MQKICEAQLPPKLSSQCAARSSPRGGPHFLHVWRRDGTGQAAELEAEAPEIETCSVNNLCLGAKEQRSTVLGPLLRARQVAHPPKN